MDGSSSLVSNNPSPPCGAELLGRFPVILTAHGLVHSQLLSQHVTTAAGWGKSPASHAVCVLPLSWRAHKCWGSPVLSLERVWSSVTAAPLLALSLCHTVEWALRAGVSGTSSQRLTSSHSVIFCMCRSRREVFNRSRLCLLAESFPLATELILHCKCQAWTSTSLRGKKAGKPQWKFYTGCDQIPLLRILALVLSVCGEELFRITFKSKHPTPNYKYNWGRKLCFLYEIALFIVVFIRKMGVIKFKGVEVCLRCFRLVCWVGVDIISAASLLIF